MKPGLQPGTRLQGRGEKGTRLGCVSMMSPESALQAQGPGFNPQHHVKILSVVTLGILALGWQK